LALWGCYMVYSPSYAEVHAHFVAKTRILHGEEDLGILTLEGQRI
jgi:DUF971 family protein